MQKFRSLVFIAALEALAGCNMRKGAVSASSPGQCIAAFNWGRSIELQGSPNLRRAIGLSGRAAYEIITLKTSGVKDGAQGEATEFTKAHYADKVLMSDLLTQCLTRQDQDPDFVRANNSGKIMQLGKDYDPICRGGNQCSST